MEPLNISATGEDRDMFVRVVSLGIDSRLEAFTRSKFKACGWRLEMQIDPEEIQILVRRLNELDDDSAGAWADDIVRECYGVELY